MSGLHFLSRDVAVTCKIWQIIFKQLTNAQLVYTTFLFYVFYILKQVVTACVCTVNV